MEQRLHSPVVQMRFLSARCTECLCSRRGLKGATCCVTGGGCVLDRYARPHKEDDCGPRPQAHTLRAVQMPRPVCARTRHICSVVSFRSYLTPVRDEESESQRKARSRQARQSRRSTQVRTQDTLEKHSLTFISHQWTITHKKHSLTQSPGGKHSLTHSLQHALTQRNTRLLFSPTTGQSPRETLTPSPTHSSTPPPLTVPQRTTLPRVCVCLSSNTRPREKLPSHPTADRPSE